MRNHYRRERLWLVAALTLLLSGCQQLDQALPFDLADGEATSLTIGTNGGIISVPPAFSLNVPAGALGGSTSVSVMPRIAEPFPSDQGTPVPGTAFDIGPVGTVLATPASVALAVDPALLELGEEARLSLALIRNDGSIVTFQGAYDLTNGVLTAEIDELGPVAAVVSVDAVPVSLEPPPTLGGGTIPQPAAPSPVGPAPTSHGGVEFSASCAPETRECFSSGLIRLWADAVLRERLGDRMFLLSPAVETSLDFRSYDPLSGLPTEIVGSIRIDGELRARVNGAVTSIDVGDGITTGPSADPTPTPLWLSGNLMIVSEATTEDGTVEFSEELEFDVRGIGTSEMLVLEVEAEIDFDDEDGGVTTGILIAHLRLRR